MIAFEETNPNSHRDASGRRVLSGAFVDLLFAFDDEPRYCAQLIPHSARDLSVLKWPVAVTPICTVLGLRSSKRAASASVTVPHKPMAMPSSAQVARISATIASTASSSASITPVPPQRGQVHWLMLALACYRDVRHVDRSFPSFRNSAFMVDVAGWFGVRTRVHRRRPRVDRGLRVLDDVDICSPCFDSFPFLYFGNRTALMPTLLVTSGSK